MPREQPDELSRLGDFAPGSAHTVTVNLFNDAYGGSASLDRNLYIDSVIFDGTQVTTGTVEQAANGVDNVAVPATNVLTLNLSEDAYQGDAHFTVSVDGKTVDEPTSVTALHSTGTSQAFNFSSMAAGTHDTPCHSSTTPTAAARHSTATFMSRVRS